MIMAEKKENEAIVISDITLIYQRSSDVPFTLKDKESPGNTKEKNSYMTLL